LLLLLRLLLLLHKLLLGLVLARRTKGRNAGQLDILLGLVLAGRIKGRYARELLLLARRAKGRVARQLHWLMVLLLLLVGHKLSIKHGGQIHIHLLCRGGCREARRRQKGVLRQGGRAHGLGQAHVHRGDGEEGSF